MVKIAYLKSSCDADHFEHQHDKVILKKKKVFSKKGPTFQNNEKFGSFDQIMTF